MGSLRARLLTALALALAAAAALEGVPALVAHIEAPGGREPDADQIGDFGRVPDFALVASSGRPVGRSDLAGFVWVASFIYTRCTESCPTQSLHLARLQAEFREAPDLRLVSITVDPEQDTPEVLRRFGERYGADPDRWLLLTGDKRAIYCLAREGFRLGVTNPAAHEPISCGAAGALPATTLIRLLATPAWATHGSQGLIMHSARLALVDRGGRIRGYHLATEPDSMERLPANLRRLLGER